MRKLVIMGLTLLISINMIACNKNTVARINDVDITKEEYKRIESFLYATGYIEKYESNSNYINEEILSFIIDNEIVYQTAEFDGIEVKNSEVNEKLENINEKLNNNTIYKDKLEALGINENYLKSQIKKDLLVSKYKDNFIKDITLTDKEINSYYGKHQGELQVIEVRASQILISTLDEYNKEVSKEEKEKLKNKAENILEEIKNGEDFEKLAKEKSDDKSSGKNGGDLGYFSKSEKNIEFTKEVLKLEKNKVPTLIETSYGYHIVKVTDKKTITKTLEESKDDIKAKILNEKYSKHIDSLYKKGKITVTY